VQDQSAHIAAVNSGVNANIDSVAKRVATTLATVEKCGDQHCQTAGRSFTAISAFTFTIRPPKIPERLQTPQRMHPEQCRRIAKTVHASEIRQEFVIVKNARGQTILDIPV
jgi:hypothetical protein